MRTNFRLFNCARLIERERVETIPPERLAELERLRGRPEFITERTITWYEWPENTSINLPYCASKNFGEMPKTAWEHQIIWREMAYFIAVRGDTPKIIRCFWWLWIRLELTLDIWIN